ncbi:MAG: TIGR01212 family radical SAM protein [Clostridia bacterium]|nr:TIGR01212 family radical SAM protein [Clostridia bacterium]
MEIYKHLNKYYKELFGERTLKICVDGGFTCPNRDGKKGFGGCIFCGEKGSGENIDGTLSIHDQVSKFLNSYRGDRANKFIVYFQNFTNTYDAIDNLKKKYDSALIDDRIIGLDIDTRADCIDEDICKLISSYKEKYHVFVELGLQSESDSIRLSINQCVLKSDFDKAIDLLNKYDIDCIVHIMVGLPGSNHDDIVKTVEYLNTKKYAGIKIHSTYVIENTALYDMYRKNDYVPLGYDEYMSELVYIISHISPDVIIHRISGDPPKETFVAPEWMLHKKMVINHIEEELTKNGLKQGILHNKN